MEPDLAPWMVSKPFHGTALPLLRPKPELRPENRSAEAPETGRKGEKAEGLLPFARGKARPFRSSVKVKGGHPHEGFAYHLHGAI